MSVLKIKNSQDEFEPVLTIDPSQEVADWMHGNAADTIDGWLDDNIMQETGYVLDRSLTASNAAAPADLVGDVKSAVQSGYNILSASTPDYGTHNGVIFSDNGDGGIKAVGTATANSACVLLISTDALPAGVESGAEYVAQYDSQNIELQVYYYAPSITIAAKTYDSCKFVFPTSVGIRCQLSVKSGTTVNEVVYPKIFRHITDMMPNTVMRLTPIRTAFYSDADCTAAFIGKMNEFAAKFGMNDTTFVTPSGLLTTGVTTPNDMLKLALAYIGDADNLMLWADMNYTVSVYGPHARTLEGSTVAEDTGLWASTLVNAQNGGRTLGMKGGSLLYDDATRSHVAMVEINGLACLITALVSGQEGYTVMYRAVGELVGMMKAKIEGVEYTGSTANIDILSEHGGYAAITIPPYSSAYLLNYPTSGLVTNFPSLARNNTVSLPLASVAKLMTTIVAKHYTIDINAPISVNAWDQTGTANPLGFYIGDTMSLRDALTVMLVNSNNVLANTVARTIGRVILTSDMLPTIRS